MADGSGSADAGSGSAEGSGSADGSGSTEGTGSADASLGSGEVSGSGEGSAEGSGRVSSVVVVVDVVVVEGSVVVDVVVVGVFAVDGLNPDPGGLKGFLVAGRSSKMISSPLSNRSIWSDTLDGAKETVGGEGAILRPSWGVMGIQPSIPITGLKSTTFEVVITFEAGGGGRREEGSCVTSKVDDGLLAVELLLRGPGKRAGFNVIGTPILIMTINNNE